LEKIRVQAQPASEGWKKECAMSDLMVDYLKALESEAASGVATEHSYRPALKSLIEGLDKGIAAVNEPKRSECGAPDYLVSNRNLTLVKLGGELSALHLMESLALNKASTAFPVAGDNVVAKGFPKIVVGEVRDLASRVPKACTPRSRSAATEEGQIGRVQINPTQYFDGVPSNVRNFTVGGYQVCDKWLKDRRGRELTHDDLQHYKKIVAALGRTIELMSQVDDTILKWPVD